MTLGNGESQDTDHYVDADLVLTNTTLPARLHLLDLPQAFDAIVGIDWLAKHGVHVHARSRTLGCCQVRSHARGRVALCMLDSRRLRR